MRQCTERDIPIAAKKASLEGAPPAASQGAIAIAANAQASYTRCARAEVGVVFEHVLTARCGAEARRLM